MRAINSLSVTESMGKLQSLCVHIEQCLDQTISQWNEINLHNNGNCMELLWYDAAKTEKDLFVSSFIKREPIQEQFC